MYMYAKNQQKLSCKLKEFSGVKYANVWISEKNLTLICMEIKLMKTKIKYLKKIEEGTRTWSYSIFYVYG